MSRLNLEKLIREAYDAKLLSSAYVDNLSDCLDDETIFALCEGSLVGPKHTAALEHLGKCDLCCVDLAFYEKFLLSSKKRMHKKSRRHKKGISEPDNTE